MTAHVPRILVVDDEPDMIVFLCAWLEDNGYAASSANNGKQALQSILENRPDLVLMDLSMPHQSGIQLYRELQYRESLRSIPVIFVTGLTQYHMFDSDCSPLPEPVACLQKPIDMECLHQAIARALGSQ
jgi:twitching motility two-component system response regulator PilH